MEITHRLLLTTLDDVTTAHGYKRKVPLGTWDNKAKKGQSADGRKFTRYLDWHAHVRSLAK